MSLKDRVKEFSILLPFMEGREKGDMERIMNTNVTIVDYGFLKDNANDVEKEYVCFVTKEDPQYFYFGGQVLTDNFKTLDADGYHDEIVAEGLPVKFEKKKSKNKREYTTVTYYPEV